MATILVIDDEQSVRRTLKIAFGELEHQVIPAGTVREGVARWREQNPDVVLLDLMLPDGDGLELLKSVQEEGLAGRVIMITGHHDLNKAIEAMRAGAFDYIHKPLNLDELELAVERALEEQRQAEKLALFADLASERSGSEIIGQSQAIIHIHKLIGMVSRGGANVLITGESGTGKELVARAIHRASTPDQPFIPVNCTAFVPTLLENELFGHEKGSFTGAVAAHPGRFELAGSGTLLLDEIGDMEPALQAKLLRVIQERRFDRIGGTKSYPFKARVVAATHRDLARMVAEGTFREDLYYRLKVVEIHLPPLRERREDIPLLVEHLLVRINRDLRRNVTHVPGSLMERLKNYEWRGKVRELENRLTSGVMLATGDTLHVELSPSTEPALPRGDESQSTPDWRRSLSDVERDHIIRVLGKVNNRFGEACAILQISRPTLRRKIQAYGIPVKFSDEELL